MAGPLKPGAAIARPPKSQLRGAFVGLPAGPLPPGSERASERAARPRQQLAPATPVAAKPAQASSLQPARQASKPEQTGKQTGAGQQPETGAKTTRAPLWAASAPIRSNSRAPFISVTGVRFTSAPEVAGGPLARRLAWAARSLRAHISRLRGFGSPLFLIQRLPQPPSSNPVLGGGEEEGANLISVICGTAKWELVIVAPPREERAKC